MSGLGRVMELDRVGGIVWIVGWQNQEIQFGIQCWCLVDFIVLM